MEQNLKTIPIIKPDLVVRIKPGSRFYMGHQMNPKDIPGKIIDTGAEWFSVLWSNGCRNQYTVDDLDFEEGLESMEIDLNKIYFEEHIVINNMNELLKTLYKNNESASETFYKVLGTEDKISQCRKGKLRSFDDIWILADTYMPGIDVKDVMKGLLLYNVTKESVEKKAIYKGFSNCSTMRRIRYTNSFNNMDNLLMKIDCNKMDSKYGWRELFGMLGIKDTESLIAWYNNEFKEKE